MKEYKTKRIKFKELSIPCRFGIIGGLIVIFVNTFVLMVILLGDILGWGV